MTIINDGPPPKFFHQYVSKFPLHLSYTVWMSCFQRVIAGQALNEGAIGQIKLLSCQFFHCVWWTNQQLLHDVMCVGGHPKKKYLFFFLSLLDFLKGHLFVSLVPFFFGWGSRPTVLKKNAANTIFTIFMTNADRCEKRSH